MFEIERETTVRYTFSTFVSIKVVAERETAAGDSKVVYLRRLRRFQTLFLATEA